MEQIKTTQETLDTINELLPGAACMGAYAMGIVSSIEFRRGRQPTRLLLEAAAQCATLDDAIAWVRAAGDL